MAKKTSKQSELVADRSIKTAAGRIAAKEHQLREMMRQRRLVLFSRRFDRGLNVGYIHGVGSTFFLVAVVRDGVRFDGFSCFRIRDLRSLEPDPHAGFAEAALRARGQQKPRRPRVDLAGNIGDLLVSASKSFPVVGVHYEETEPDRWWVGRVTKVTRSYFSLLEIDQDAVWSEEPSEYRLNSITCVEFGGEYLAAMHLIGGEPKAGLKAPSR